MTGQAHVISTGTQTLTFGSKVAMVVLVAYNGAWVVQSADSSVTVS